MSRLWMQALALLVAFTAWAGPARAQPDLERRLDAFVAPLVATNNYSGVVLVARGDRVLVQRAYGLASQELAAPNTLQTKFQIASTSKPITSAAVLKLVERGQVDLDGAISRYVPDFPNGEHITVRMLLNHTSGLPDVNQLPIYTDLGLKRRTPAEIVAAFKDAKVLFEPGAKQSYSNSNYALLALIIEKVSGQSYGQFLQQEIFGPLGMAGAGHRADQTAILAGMSTGYVPDGRTGLKRPPWFDWTVKTGNGSLYATADDLRRFAVAYFAGRVIRPDLVTAAATAVPGSLSYGLGWFVDRHLDRTRLSHGGRSPGYTSQLLYYPDERLTVVVLSNNYAVASLAVADTAAALALGQPYEALNLSDAPAAPAAFSPVLGTYQFGPDFRAPNMKVMITQAGGRLTMESDAPFFGPTPLLARGPLAYVDRTYWADVVFQRGPDGEVTGFTFTSTGFTFQAKRLP